jgi:SAM-dependent methyltransferase
MSSGSNTIVRSAQKMFNSLYARHRHRHHRNTFLVTSSFNGRNNDTDAAESKVDRRRNNRDATYLCVRDSSTDAFDVSALINDEDTSSLLSSSSAASASSAPALTLGRVDFGNVLTREIKELFVNSLRKRSNVCVKRISCTGRRNGSKTQEYKKSDLKYVSIKGKYSIQLVQFTDTQSFTKNFPLIRNSNNSSNDSDSDDVVMHIVRDCGYANFLVEMIDESSYSIRVTKGGDAFVRKQEPQSKRNTINANTVNLFEHNREKKRLMRAEDPFLVHVGVSTVDGKIIASKNKKYQEVEAFLHHLDQSLSTISREKKITVVDLGCGNAYLTFATYSFLKNEKSIETNVIGVDVKKQSKEHNEKVAKTLGWDSEVEFVQGTIENAEISFDDDDADVDVCIALHACDTATDQALARAVRWNTKVILCSPCCHQDLHRRIKISTNSRTELMTPLKSIATHGILYQRTIDNVTDAWRALILRLLGYKVDVVEFISGEHTNRNTLIRARYNGAKATKELWKEHDEMIAEFGCDSYLSESLRDELANMRKELM